MIIMYLDPQGIVLNQGILESLALNRNQSTRPKARRGVPSFRY